MCDRTNSLVEFTMETLCYLRPLNAKCWWKKAMSAGRRLLSLNQTSLHGEDQCLWRAPASALEDGKPIHRTKQIHQSLTGLLHRRETRKKESNGRQKEKIRKLASLGGIHSYTKQYIQHIFTHWYTSRNTCTHLHTINSGSSQLNSHH